MSSSHERDRPTFNNVPAPDVPRRIRSNHASGSTHRHPAIREIHKNAWLKKLGASEKKGASFIKKVEKYWVVFCVHDDVDAFLEFYTEPKMGAIHKPLSAISVNSCLHVSPSLMGQDNEYEFAVTLPTQVIRLIACNWEQMREWVDSLQGKLREMNILGPKDNVYSALPEIHGCTGLNVLIRTQNGAGFVSTRDPNSPLPPTPISNVSVASEEEILLTAANRDGQILREVVESERGIIHRAVTGQRGLTESSLLTLSPHVSKTCNNEAESHLCSSQQKSTIETSGDSTIQHSTLTVACPAGVEVGNLVRKKLTVDQSCPVEDVLNFNLNEVSHEPVSQFVSLALSNRTITPNTSVVQVQFDDAVKPRSSNISQNEDNLLGVSVTVLPPSSLSRISSLSDSLIVSSQVMSSRASTTLEKQKSSVEAPQLNPQGNVYEHLLVSGKILNSSTAALNTSFQAFSNAEKIIVNNTTTHTDCIAEDVTPPAVPKRNLSHSKQMHKGNVSNFMQGSSSVSGIEQQEVNLICTVSEEHQEESSSNQANLRHGNIRADVVRAIDSCASLSDTAQSFINRVSPSQESRPVEGMIGVRSGEYRIRRDVIVGGSPQNTESEQVLEGSVHTVTALNHVPLKEQQVMRLQSEINHQGGVRIVLRKKDCVSSIAFVDYLGAVWITGWKQQQHPVLYYAFHVGDQVLKIGGVTVQNSAEAYRAIKLVSSMQVEFIIKRLPYGSVLVLKRKLEGEPLGLVSVRNSGEIEVASNGLAASQGLLLRSPATDGQSTCNWFLTEINNRPLSLFAKEAEVRDRLSAVGKEISILVQPADLVKHLRKQLKSVKSFKEYLIV